MPVSKYTKDRLAVQSRKEKQREYQKQCIIKRKQCGVCITCGSQKEDQSVQFCSTCRKKRNEAERRRYNENTENALCVRCGSTKPEQDSRECTECGNIRRAKVLERTYGITAEEYEQILIQQNRVCWICGGTVKSRRGKLHVDHNHDTGEVRGLLCINCNRGLGNFRDSIELLKRAIEYLDKGKV